MKNSPIQRSKPMSRTGILGQSSFQRLAAPAKPPKGPKLKKCANRACRSPYMPNAATPWVNWCSFDCGAALGMEKDAKRKLKVARAERAATKAALMKYKPLKWFRAKAKKVMHLYVRTRDEGKQCCSCDTLLLNLGRIGGDYDAGHLRSVGSAKHLEFDPRNVWGQCKYCNDTLHGNEREYERRLRLREGDAMVDALMADNEERHLKRADFEAIEAHYKQKLKELK